MRCFVTVGTTKFDALIEALLEDRILSVLQSLGFTELSIQSGHYDMEAHLNGLKSYVQEICSRNGTLYANSRGLKVRINRVPIMPFLDSFQELFPVYCARDEECRFDSWTRWCWNLYGSFIILQTIAGSGQQQAVEQSSIRAGRTSCP